MARYISPLRLLPSFSPSQTNNSDSPARSSIKSIDGPARYKSDLGQALVDFHLTIKVIRGRPTQIQLNLWPATHRPLIRSARPCNSSQLNLFRSWEATGQTQSNVTPLDTTDRNIYSFDSGLLFLRMPG
jgi:hypothetical protein